MMRFQINPEPISTRPTPDLTGPFIIDVRGLSKDERIALLHRLARLSDIAVFQHTWTRAPITGKSFCDGYMTAQTWYRRQYSEYLNSSDFIKKNLVAPRYKAEDLL